MKREILLLNIIIGISIIFSSCNSGITYPPVSSTVTQEHNQGQFLWHDLATSSPEIAMKFYAEVFGWQFETLGSGSSAYYVVKNNGKPVGGIFKLADKYGNTAEWISSISVDDVDEALTYNLTKGGKVVFKKEFFVGRGETALIQDPQNALIALLHSESGDPTPVRAADVEMNSWLWDELWTNNLQGSLDFYEGLVAYEASEVENSKRPYFIFKRDNRILSGAIGNPVEGGSRSAWMPYIKVQDVNETLAKAKKAGARVMLEPGPEIRKGTVAVLLDPTGAQFTIQQWILR